MNVVRLSIGAAFSLIVTFGLFVLMFTLIDSGDVPLDETKARKITDIIMPDTKIDDIFKPKKPKKPEPEDEPPPEAAPPEQEIIDFTKVPTNLNQNIKTDVNIGGVGGINTQDGEYLPIVKVAPIYPRQATSRGIQGYCIVEYTVTKSGATKDPIPVDCDPKGIFERASVQAAMKFKYKPRVVDGQAIEVEGVQNRFLYQLEE